MKYLLIFTLAALGLWVMQAQAESGVHQGQYQKNLSYKGPVTGDEIIYTLYLPPGHGKDKGPYPLIVFLHGARASKTYTRGLGICSARETSQAQQAFADASQRAVWIDTDDLNGEKNALHLIKPEGYETLGKRYVEAAVELVKAK
jgi:predicted peptidase